MGGRLWEPWEENALRYFADGLNCGAISTIIGRSHHATHCHRVKMGLDTPFVGSGRKTTVAEVDDIRRMAAEGMPYSRIAKHVRVCRRVLSDIMRRHGIVTTSRAVHGFDRSIRTYPKRDIKKMQIALYSMAGRMTQKSAARKLGVSLPVVECACSRAGIIWSQGYQSIWSVAEQFGCAYNTIRAHRAKLRQTWGKRLSMRSPSNRELADLARSILESRRDIMGSLLALKRLQRDCENQAGMDELEKHGTLSREAAE